MNFSRDEAKTKDVREVVTGERIILIPQIGVYTVDMSPYCVKMEEIPANKSN